jgi:FkbM family methyltransferase
MIIGRLKEFFRKERFNGFVAQINGPVELLKKRISRGLEKKHSATAVTHKEAIDWFERRKQEYDQLISAASPYIRRDSIIFDIGANIGYFTFLLLQRLDYNGTAYLFEPVPHLAKLCKTTFRDVPFNVTVFDFGLSDRDTEEDIFIAGDGNLGWNTLISQKATSDMKKISIRLKTFDTCGIDVTPSFVKIDVEGAEYMVLKGMLGSLRKWHPLPVVLCEVGWGQDHPAWEEELWVFTEMKRIGYTICNLDGLLIDETSLQRTTDVLFIPQKA